MTVKGVLWHSTGAENAYLKRYVQPSNTKPAADTYSRAKWLELLGTNTNGNDYNHVKNDVGMNCWIGKLNNGTVTTVQTMPWNYVPWGVGSGVNQPCNNGWIQFEICEDDLSDVTYFNQIYKEACEITAYLCKMYNINPEGSVNVNGKTVPTILCHQDSYKLGLGSNHGDVYHWFNKYGKNMATARSDVSALMKGYSFDISPDTGSTSAGSSDSGSSSSGGTSEGTTVVVSTGPVKPIESVLVQKLSVISQSFDGVKIRLVTGSSFNSYNWSYKITCLQTGKTATKSFKVTSTKTDIVIKSLAPNNCYLLEIIAKDSLKNIKSVPGFMFSTKNDAPREVTNVDFKITGNVLSKMNCKISFVHPDFWGFYDTNVIGRGYRVSLYINGEEKGYSDTLISAGSHSKEITFVKLLNELKIAASLVHYNDIIQIGILPWIRDSQKRYIFAEPQAKSSQPVRLSYYSNIYNLHKWFLKTSSGFKQIALFNFSK
jgi:hypothetical protein